MTVLADIRKGESLETTLEPVSRMDLIKYSGSSGDFNPIHTIDEEAKKGWSTRNYCSWYVDDGQPFQAVYGLL